MPLPSFDFRAIPLILCSLASLPLGVQAQIVPDTTLGAESSIKAPLFPLLPSIERIDGGAMRGQNLFHSFQEFNIAPTSGAYFIVPNTDITNIFARVTGNKPSEIFGILGVRQPNLLSPQTDLYFINPNGVLFGETSVLDVGGSFSVTTATGVSFGALGSFTANEPMLSTDLLTVNPSAYLFSHVDSENIGNIISRSGQLDFVDQRFRGLRVPNGETLTLLGGNVTINGGGRGHGLTALGGRIEVGSVRDLGAIEIESSGQLLFPDMLRRGNVEFSQNSASFTSLDGQGDIRVFAGNISVIENSFVATGISSNNSLADAQAGDLVFDATNLIKVGERSGIGNLTFSNTRGSAGDIFLVADALEITGGSSVLGGTSGTGNTGNIFIDARTITIDTGRISNNLETNGQGSGGDIQIAADMLQLSNGGELEVNTLGLGNSGNIFIDTNSLILSDNTAIRNTTEDGSVGNGGNIEITTEFLQVLGGSRLISGTSGIGDAGNISVNASKNILFDENSGILNRVETTGVGNSGDIALTANSLLLLQGSQLSTSILGQGDSGDINLNVLETISIDGLSSGIRSNILQRDSIRTAGDIIIAAGNLFVANGAQIQSAIAGRGIAGDILINVDGLVSLDGAQQLRSIEQPSGLFNRIAQNAEGISGTITVNSGKLLITNGAQISASTEGQGDGGNINLLVSGDLIFENGGDVISNVSRDAVGNAGDIRVSAGSLSATNGSGSIIQTTTFGRGNAGSIELDIQGHLLLSDTSLISSRVAQNAMGNGGGLSIQAQSIELLNGGQINSTTSGQGNAGNILLTASDAITLEGTSQSGLFNSRIDSSVRTSGIGSGGGVEIRSGSLNVLNGASIRTATNGTGDAGDIFISTMGDTRFEGTSSDSNFSSVAVSGSDGTANGDGGDIRIRANSLQLLEGGAISGNFLGNGSAGNIVIHAANDVTIEDSRNIPFPPTGIANAIGLGRVDDSGGIEIRARRVKITGTPADVGNAGSALRPRIATSSIGTAAAGDILIVATDSFEVRDGLIALNSLQSSGGTVTVLTDRIQLTSNSDIITAVLDGSGQGGEIQLIADSFIVALGDSDILAFSRDGRGGDVTLRTPGFFGENFQAAPQILSRQQLLMLDGNNRVDINATGSLDSGSISLSNIDFIENSLTELPDNLVNPEALVSSSCIARSDDSSSGFTITGSDSLPQQPNSAQSTYSLSSVQPITDEESYNNLSIIEPHSVYRLADGRLIMSQECEK
ncbi:MAG: filamentous hemagglutinin N-terminal domain-containing protein [Cyanobacteria bacterium P01_B01_bin.77]